MIRQLKKLFSTAKQLRSSRLNNAEASLEFDVESLESRKMLAGNVSVSVNGNNLILTGDAADNQVEVYEDGGMVWVSALDDTSLSGDADSDFFNTGIAAGALNNVKANMKAGNDWVDFGYTETLGDFITGLVIQGNLVVKTGVGDDTVFVSAAVAGKTIVKTGAGSDELTFEEASFAGRVRANAGAGDDFVRVLSIEIGGKVGVKMSAGWDYFYIDTTQVVATTTILPVLNGGGGGDDDIDTDFSLDFNTILGVGIAKLKGFEQ